MQKLIPIGIHVLIEPLPPESEFVLVQKSKAKQERGIIVEVGEAVESELIKKSVGKTALFRQYSEEEYLINGTKLYLIEESDIMGILEK